MSDNGRGGSGYPAPPAKRAVCPTPHKKSFVTKRQAKDQLKADRAYFSKKAPKIYVYHCVCGMFHFTKTIRKDAPKPPTTDLNHESRFQQFLKK